MSSSLRLMQQSKLKSMLRFESSASSSPIKNNTSTTFKVFVYDKAAIWFLKSKIVESTSSSSRDVIPSHRIRIHIHNFCRDVVTPLLTVNELRECGVTLHLPLHSSREKIAEVPAVYFCEPSAKNIERIAKDVSEDKYRSFYLNFSSPLPRALLESLAQKTIQSGRASRISKICDQYMPFASLSAELFTLNSKNTFRTYLDPKASEKAITSKMDEISQSILSVLATASHLPIITCARGGASEAVSRRLSKSLRHSLAGSDSLFSSSEHVSRSLFGAQRPLLLVLERSDDLVAVMRHSIVYQDLVSDLLTYSLNRVTFRNSTTKRMQTYSLDPNTDEFWKMHAGDEFHVAVKTNNTELQQLNAKVERLQSLASKLQGAVEAPKAGSELAEAVETLPKLLKRKKQLTQHTSILEALMDEMDRRSLHQFYKAEQTVLTSPDQEPEQFMDLMSEGTLDDRLRFLFVCASVNASFLDSKRLDDCLFSMQAAIRGATASSGDGGDGSSSSSSSSDEKANILRAEKTVQYLKGRIREREMMMDSAGRTSPPRKTRTTAQRGVLGSLLAKGVKELSQRLGTGYRHEFAVTKLLKACCSTRNDEDKETKEIRKNMMLLDPRVDDEDESKRRRSRVPFNCVIVFVIGGGTTSEMLELRKWSESDPLRSFAYGCTELTNAKDLLDQIVSL